MMQADEFPKNVSWILISDRNLGYPTKDVFRARPKAFLFREKDLSGVEFEKLASECLAHCRENQVPFILHIGSQETLQERLAFVTQNHLVNVHLPGELGMESLPKGSWIVGKSIHHPSELDSSYSYFLVAPVFPPFDKPDVKSLGVEGVKIFESLADRKLFFLGGLNLTNLSSLGLSSRSGFAIRSEIWKSPSPFEEIKKFNALFF